MKNVFKTVCFALVALALTGCGESKKGGIPTNFDNGKVENGVFVNKFFDFQMTLPSDWVVQDETVSKALTETGADIVTNGDEALKEAALVETANMLYVSQYEIGTETDFNSSLIVMAENLAKYPQITNSSVYLSNVKTILEQTQGDMLKVDGDFQKINLGGKEFMSISTQASVPMELFDQTENPEMATMNLQQTYYCSIINGFALSVIMTYSTPQQKDILDKAVSSIKFN